jgi:DNA-binding CsgD family transcriptional regulator
MTDSGEPLSEREIEILRLVATGASNKEIATILVISPNTVKVHLRNIFGKIGVVSRTEATLFAFKNGIVAQPSEPTNSINTFSTYPAPEAASPLALAPDPATFLKESKPLQTRRSNFWVLGIMIIILIAALASAPSILRAASPTPTATQPAILVFPPRWQVAKSLPETRTGMAGAIVQGKLYLAGGETEAGITNDLLAYDPDSLTWSRLPSKPTAVTDAQAVVIGDIIYIPGGRQADGTPVRIFEAYNPRLNKWENRASLPVALSQYAIAAHEGNLYLFGGWDGKQYVKTAYRYDPDTDQWNESSSMDQARGLAAAVDLEGKIILIGGRDDHSVLPSVLFYYPERDGSGESPWEAAPDLPEARFGHAAAALASTTYVLGGQTASEAEAGLQPILLSNNSKEWQPFDSPIKLIGSRITLLPTGNFLHIFGGETVNGISDEHLVFQALYSVAIPLLSNNPETPTP